MVSQKERENNIYNSAKAMFEQAIDVMLEHHKNGNHKRAAEYKAALIQTYNETLDSNRKMDTRIRAMQGN